MDIDHKVQTFTKSPKGNHRGSSVDALASIKTRIDTKVVRKSRGSSLGSDMFDNSSEVGHAYRPLHNITSGVDSIGSSSPSNHNNH